MTTSRVPRQTPELERMLVRSGIRLFKLLVLGQPRRAAEALQIARRMIRPNSGLRPP